MNMSICAINQFTLPFIAELYRPIHRFCQIVSYEPRKNGSLKMVSVHCLDYKASASYEEEELAEVQAKCRESIRLAQMSRK